MLTWEEVQAVAELFQLVEFVFCVMLPEVCTVALAECVVLMATCSGASSSFNE